MTVTSDNESVTSTVQGTTTGEEKVTHRVRRAAQSDAADLARVQRASWQAAFRGLLSDGYLDGLEDDALRNAWEHLLARSREPLADILIVSEADCLVGYSRFYPTDDNDDDSLRVGMIGSIYTLPEVWGAGVGKALTSAVLDAMTAAGYAEATLWVLEGNTRARSFYERNGWQHDGATTADHSDGVPVIKMRYRRGLDS
jgi:GNAT superfamily N-acetyltransferase